MSLVNDMLRDLDSRRQDAPGRGNSADRLIPAAGISRDRKSVAAVVKGVLITLVGGLVIAAAVLFLLDAFRPRSNNPVADFQPVTQPVAPAATVPQTTPDAEIMEEMERITQRMQMLEQQNQELLQQARNAAVSAPNASPLPNQIVPAAVDDVVSQQSSPVLTPEFPQAVSVQQSSLSLTAPVSPAAPEVSTLTRSPSELSFRETDRQQVQNALELWQGNRRTEALQNLKQFAAQNQGAHQSREMLAKLLLQQGDTIAAMEQADIGARIAPDYTGYKKIKARVLMAAGVPRDAAELLGAEQPSLASDSEYHELLAASRLAAQLYDDALLSYEALAANAPDNGLWWYGVGASLDALGRSFQAAQAYERAIQLGGLSANLLQVSQQRVNALRQN